MVKRFYNIYAAAPASLGRASTVPPLTWIYICVCHRACACDMHIYSRCIRRCWSMYAFTHLCLYICACMQFLHSSISACEHVTCVHKICLLNTRLCIAPASVRVQMMYMHKHSCLLERMCAPSYRAYMLHVSRATLVYVLVRVARDLWDVLHLPCVPQMISLWLTCIDYTWCKLSLHTLRHACAHCVSVHLASDMYAWCQCMHASVCAWCDTCALGVTCSTPSVTYVCMAWM